MPVFVPHPPRRQDFKQESRGIFSSGGISFFIGLALFLFTLAGYGGLLFMVKSQEGTVEQIDQSIKEKSKSVSNEMLQKLDLFSKKISVVKKVLNNHIFTSNVLEVIERSAHPQVQFEDFDFSYNERQVKMKAKTIDFATLAQQISFFENDPKVEQLKFGGLSFDSEDRMLNFELTIILKKDTFGYKALEADNISVSKE